MFLFDKTRDCWTVVEKMLNGELFLNNLARSALDSFLEIVETNLSVHGVSGKVYLMHEAILVDALMAKYFREICERDGSSDFRMAIGDKWEANGYVLSSILDEFQDAAYMVLTFENCEIPGKNFVITIQ